MKKRAISLVLFLLMVVLAFAGCAASETSAVALKFYNALKDGDTDAMMECLDPETVKTLNKQLEAAGMEFSDVFDISTMMDEEGIDVSTLKFRVVKEDVEGDTATVTVEVSYKDDGENVKENTELPLKKVDGKWYVSFGF